MFNTIVAAISQMFTWLLQAPCSIQDTIESLCQTLLSVLGLPTTSLAPGHIHTYI